MHISYIFICIYKYICCVEKLKNKVIQSEEFNMKVSRRYNVSVLKKTSS